MVHESYPCYVRIGKSLGSEELIELPTEADGTIQLTTITAQFPDATGLKYKSESGEWRAMLASEGVLDLPLEGWGDSEYTVTVAKKAVKRKLADSEDSIKRTKQDISDLIVLGLPYSTTLEDLETYFKKFGTLEHCEIKLDARTKQSRGFGFIRYSSVDVAETVLSKTHSLGGRNLEVRVPTSGQGNTPMKLFIGRLPRETTVDDLADCFSDYAPLKDVYIPPNFRGFGFVTFRSQAEAQEVLNSTYMIKGMVVNILRSAPKKGIPQLMEVGKDTMEGTMEGNMQDNRQGGMHGNMQGGMKGNMQGNMQGGMQGNMQGGMQGNMQGGMQGNMQGNMQGGMLGGMQSNASMQGGMQRGMKGNMQVDKFRGGYKSMYS